MNIGEVLRWFEKLLTHTGVLVRSPFTSYVQDTQTGATNRPTGKLCDVTTSQPNTDVETGALYTENCSELSVAVHFGGAPVAAGTLISFVVYLDDDTPLNGPAGQGLFTNTAAGGEKDVVYTVGRGATGAIPNANALTAPYCYAIPIAVPRRLRVKVYAAGAGVSARIVVWGR